jgi:hypothetical protein
MEEFNDVFFTKTHQHQGRCRPHEYLEGRSLLLSTTPTLQLQKLPSSEEVPPSVHQAQAIPFTLMQMSLVTCRRLAAVRVTVLVRGSVSQGIMVAQNSVEMVVTGI